MTPMLPQCQNLQEQVESLLHLSHQEPSLRMLQDKVIAVQASLRKAIAPTFEIVFAGAFRDLRENRVPATLEKRRQKRRRSCSNHT